MGALSASRWVLLMTIMMMKILTILATASILVVQANNHHSLKEKNGLELQKEMSNTIQHGPVYTSLKKDEKYARKKAKYYKKLLGHKGEHRVANTKHDQDDFTLQDLTLTPAMKMHKISKNYNKMMKTESLKPHNKKLYKKLLKKEKFKKMKLQKKKQNKKNSQIP